MRRPSWLSPGEKARNASPSVSGSAWRRPSTLPAGSSCCGGTRGVVPPERHSGRDREAFFLGWTARLRLMGKVAIQMPKVLIVTNDFPPRSGGIQSFVHALAMRLPAGQVVVYAPAWTGAAEFDGRQPFPVVRHPSSLMLPVPAVRDRATAALTEHGCDRVLFGAAAPLGLLAPALRQAGADR